MSRFWLIVCVIITAVLTASLATNLVYPHRMRGDPLPPRWIGRAFIGTLLGLAGVAVWAFYFQDRLRRRQFSLMSLLLLPPAAVVPIKVGFWLLADNWLFWPDE
jgi:hypothetical protein